MDITNIPRNIITGICINTIWKIIVVVLWISLGMFSSDYYRFGPSDTLMLAFVDIPINTWPKYMVIISYVIIDCLLKVVSGDFVYPWINAVVMNPSITIKQNKSTTYILTNYYWGLNSFNTIFFFALSMSQVDFALVGAISGIIAGMISSYYVIFDPKRDVEGIPLYNL